MHLTRQVRKFCVGVQRIGSEVRSLSVVVPIGSGMLRKRTVGVGNFSGRAGSLAGEHPHRNGEAPILTAAVRQIIVPEVDDLIATRAAREEIEPPEGEGENSARDAIDEIHHGGEHGGNQQPDDD